MNERTNEATLRTGAGKWDVGLWQDEDGEMIFAEGWKEFIEHHSLGKAELLVFKYNSDMSFDVVIYDRNGCIRNDQSVETPHHVLNFRSCFPFFKHRIRSSNVGSRSILQIPQAFTRRHLCMSQQTMNLRNSEGVSWPVTITVTSGNVLALYGGWKAFSDDNSIKIGDVCIFEMVEQNVMQVHIFK